MESPSVGDSGLAVHRLKDGAPRKEQAGTRSQAGGGSIHESLALLSTCYVHPPRIFTCPTLISPLH